MRKDLCAVVPVYDHAQTTPRTLAVLADLGLQTFVIDDGSNTDEARALAAAVSNQPGATLFRLPINRGKGAAVKEGLLLARHAGFSHALQVDADGQHDPVAIRTLVDAIAEHPAALISGLPQFDDSVPKHRLYSRYLTHVWVWINTLSKDLVDSMCGLRVYPIAATVALIRRRHIGNRMDFDTDIMVQLYRQNIEVRFIPCNVSYPEHGQSHFRPLNDNVRISLMHTRHFLTLPWWWFVHGR